MERNTARPLFNLPPELQVKTQLNVDGSSPQVSEKILLSDLLLGEVRFYADVSDGLAILFRGYELIIAQKSLVAAFGLGHDANFEFMLVA